MDRRMPVLLRLVEAGATREDEVGASDKFLLEIEQLLRRETELRKLVHAIVDDYARVEMPRKRQHHRRVIPGDDRPRAAGSVRVQKAPQGILPPRFVQALRQMRSRDADIRKILGLANLQIGGLPTLYFNRLFSEDD